MTVLEQYFIDTVDMLDEIGVDYFIHGSTLLGKVRNNTLLDRPDVKGDKELNFGILADDFTPRVYLEIKKRSQYFLPCEEYLPNSLVYFSTYPPEEDMWKIPAFSLMSLFWKGKTKWIEYMNGDCCMMWDRSHLDDKTKWETVEILGKTVKTPYLKEKWLQDYFGPDYMTERKSWHFTWGSVNRESFLHLLEDEEFIL